MATPGVAWLASHFDPVVASLPDDVESTEDAEQRRLAFLVLVRLSAAVDALAQTGVLTDAQQEHCRSALASKGLVETKVHSWSSGVVTRAVEGGSRRDPTPHELLHVIGLNRVLGLVEGEPCRLLSVEVWDSEVRAHLLLSTDLELRRPGRERRRGFPGWSTTWLLRWDDAEREGHVGAGHGSGDQARLEVVWPCTLPDTCRDVELLAEEDGRVVGRTAVTW